jgi:hypothetical protein
MLDRAVTRLASAGNDVLGNPGFVTHTACRGVERKKIVRWMKWLHPAHAVCEFP